MYVGFGNGDLGVWNMLTPIDCDIHKYKEVIFKFENLIRNF